MRDNLVKVGDEDEFEHRQTDVNSSLDQDEYGDCAVSDSQRLLEQKVKSYVVAELPSRI